MVSFSKNNIASSLLFIFLLSLIPQFVYATTDIDFYSGNDIIFYSPDGCSEELSQTTGTSVLDGYTLPAEKGKAGFEEEINSKGRIPSGGKVTFEEHASLGQEYRDYYITMRWRYVKGWNWNGTAAKPVDNKQYNWFAKEPRIVLVTNTRNGKSINSVALEAGPGPWTGVDRSSNNNPKQGWVNPQDGTPSTYTGRVAGFPPVAVKALGMKQGMYDGTGDVLTYQWAQDQKVKPGPTTASAGSATDASTSTTAIKSSIKLEKNDTLQQIYDALIKGGMSAVQASAVMGNMYAESSFNSGAVEAGSGEGYGLAQWSFGRKDKLFAFADKKGVPRDDVAMQLEFLLNEYNETYKSKLDSTDFKAGTDVAKSTKAWMMKFEVPAMKPANDPAALNSKRIPAANKIMELYGGGAGVGESGCKESSTGNGAIAGDIVQTALNLALPKPATNGMNKESDAKPEFIEAVKKYNPPLGSRIADCGAFVGTVMKASGVDKDYPGISTVSQMNYVKSHTDKYKIIDKPKKSDLQPGDIIIAINGNKRHTLIYTGNTPYPAVDASLNQRVPSVRNDSSLADMLARGGTVVAARLIK